MLSNAYDIVIDRGFGLTRHIKYVVYGLNATVKRFLTILMKTVQLTGTSTNHSNMVIHTSMSNIDIILAR